MKTKDFEKAIEDLGCGIDILEMKNAGCQVNLCIGHIDETLLYWDAFGRAFVLDDAADYMAIAEDINDNLDLFTRDPAYDLKFN